MSELNKIKAIDLMTTELAPLIFENDFRKFRKGYYVRMRGEILQYIYLSTFRPPYGIKFGAIPYWATEEEKLLQKEFDLFGSYDTSDLADKLEGYNDFERWQRDPSYRRWWCFDVDHLANIVPLYAEKLQQYVFPLLNQTTNFDEYIVMQKKLAELYQYDYFSQLPHAVIQQICVLDNSFDCVHHFMIRSRLKIEQKFLDAKEKSKIYYDVERARNSYHNDIDLLEKTWKSFTDAALMGSPNDIFGVELMNRRIKGGAVIRKLLKLEVK